MAPTCASTTATWWAVKLPARPAAWLACLTLAVLLWAAFSPLRDTSREKLLVFGASDRAVPAAVRLTLGVQDVLLLRNDSHMAHVFGQLRVQPGHAFRLPFEQAGTFGFTCSARPDGQEVVVQVVAPPDPGYARLRWRVIGLVETLRYLPSIAPFAS